MEILFNKGTYSRKNIMGKPIQKKWFGLESSPGSQIVVDGVKFANGTTASDAYIVRQVGSTAYIVQDTALTLDAEIVFMVNATSTGALSPGQCYITATPYGGSARPCKKITQFRVSLYEADGTVGNYSWSTLPAAGKGQANLIGAAELPGRILTITVGTVGKGYFTGPSVTFTGGGAAAVATSIVAAGSVTGFTLSAGGYGYTAGGVVLSAPPASITSTATAVVTAGSLTSFASLVGGGYYVIAPVVTLSAPPASITATASGTETGGVVDPVVSVDIAGGYYTVAPGVTVLGGNSDATAHAVISGGQVTSIVIDNGGTGYTTPVAFTIDAPPVATQAVATALIAGGHVTGFTIGTPGTGYFVAPTCGIAAPPAAQQATATATFAP